MTDGRRRIEGDTERLYSVVDRMDAGTLRGGVKSAAPIALPPNPRRYIEPRAFDTHEEVLFRLPISLPGYIAITEDYAVRFKLGIPFVVDHVLLTLDRAGGSNTVVEVFQTGASIGSLTFGSGDHEVTAVFGDAFADTDYLQMFVTEVGSGSPAAIGGYALLLLG